MTYVTPRLVRSNTVVLGVRYVRWHGTGTVPGTKISNKTGRLQRTWSVPVRVCSPSSAPHRHWPRAVLPESETPVCPPRLAVVVLYSYRVRGPTSRRRLHWPRTRNRTVTDRVCSDRGPIATNISVTNVAEGDNFLFNIIIIIDKWPIHVTWISTSNRSNPNTSGLRSPPFSMFNFNWIRVLEWLKVIR